MAPVCYWIKLSDPDCGCLSCGGCLWQFSCFYIILVFFYWLWSSFVQLSWLSEVLEKSRNSRWIEDGHRLNLNHNVLASRCRPQRKHLWAYYSPSKFHCHSNILAEISRKRGGGGGRKSDTHPSGLITVFVLLLKVALLLSAKTRVRILLL